MHEIKCEKRAGQRGGQGVFGYFFGKQIYYRNHDDAKKSTCDAPSERIHAKNCHSQCDQNLAQGRMGVFIGGQTVYKFVGSTPVIDFIKIHAVAESTVFRVQRGFVK
jgi:hypothetical protein